MLTRLGGAEAGEKTKALICRALVLPRSRRGARRLLGVVLNGLTACVNGSPVQKWLLPVGYFRTYSPKKVLGRIFPACQPCGWSFLLLEIPVFLGLPTAPCTRFGDWRRCTARRLLGYCCYMV